MTQQLRVAIIAGGLNHEREVSLRSAHRVARALREAGHEVNTFCVFAQLQPGCGVAAGARLHG